MAILLATSPALCFNSSSFASVLSTLLLTRSSPCSAPLGSIPSAIKSLSTNTAMLCFPLCGLVDCPLVIAVHPDALKHQEYILIVINRLELRQSRIMVDYQRAYERGYIFGFCGSEPSRGWRAVELEAAPGTKKSRCSFTISFCRLNSVRTSSIFASITSGVSAK